MRRLIVFIFIFFSILCRAQHIAVKNNLIGDALLVPNISGEITLGNKWSVDALFQINSILYTKNPTSKQYKTNKFSHWMVQPGIRYWTCEVFNGFFVGVHSHAGQMNVGGKDIPFILKNKNHIMADHRYEGWFYGAGMSMGYHFILSKRFSVEVEAGLGYAHINYNRFKCTACGKPDGRGEADYLGPTKAALSLIYILR
jgi:hypothetical protein